VSLATLVRKGVKLANRVTSSLQTTVQLRVASGTVSLYGKAALGNAQDVSALVDLTNKNMVGRDGNVHAVRATVTVLDATVTVGYDDVLTLPNGETGPIIEIRGGVVDPATGRSYAPTVFLGGAQME
jgi:prophage DNA circulation protein